MFIYGSGVFIWLFLAITQPFGIYNSNVSDLQLLLYLMPVGLTWVVITIGVDFIAQNILKLKTGENYLADLIGWLVKLAIAIHFIYILRGILCNWHCVNLVEYLQLWLAYVLMFGFCYLPYMLYARNKFFQNLVVLGKDDDTQITLTGSGKEHFKIEPDSIIYLQSDNNYIDIVLKSEKDQLQKKALRITLSSAENQLKPNSEFIRIHRSYMINSKYFHSLSKGSNTLSISYNGQIIDLPVSRKYKPEIVKLFTHHI